MGFYLPCTKYSFINDVCSYALLYTIYNSFNFISEYSLEELDPVGIIWGFVDPRDWCDLDLWGKDLSKWCFESAGIDSRMVGFFGPLGKKEWMHIWLVLGYGTVQPFLPAALIATGNWFWRIIALWRSIGWTIMLVFLFYAPFRALKKVKETLVPAGITVIVWIGILLAAFRGGGDQWDNPRYRVVYIGLQASLMAWVWIKQRETGDPWLRRILVGFGMVFAWFVPWYLRRYSGTFTWPIIDLFKTVALGFITAILYWLWDWARREELTKGTDKGG